MVSVTGFSGNVSHLGFGMSGSRNSRHFKTFASFPAHMHVFEWGR